MILTHRPLDRYPNAETTSRQHSQFSATWSQTLRLLDRELAALGASHPVLMSDISETEIRLDGQPYERARPRTPRVVIAFETRRFGPLKYACDRFHDWQDNVRAIALGLEALRKVERYGIATRGEQYTGWKMLPPAAPEHTRFTYETALVFFDEQAVAVGLSERGWFCDDGVTLSAIRDGYRLLAKSLHPDAGGDPELFKRLGEARDVLELHHHRPGGD